jgi:hypothetical protein
VFVAHHSARPWALLEARWAYFRHRVFEQWVCMV